VQDWDDFFRHVIRFLFRDMSITVPSMASLGGELEDVSVEDVRNVSSNQFLTGILVFGRFGAWCKQCLAAMEDPVILVPTVLRTHIDSLCEI
jgi:hypothetical protein